MKDLGWAQLPGPAQVGAVYSAIVSYVGDEPCIEPASCHQPRWCGDGIPLPPHASHPSGMKGSYECAALPLGDGGAVQLSMACF